MKGRKNASAKPAAAKKRASSRGADKTKNDYSESEINALKRETGNFAHGIRPSVVPESVARRNAPLSDTSATSDVTIEGE